MPTRRGISVARLALGFGLVLGVAGCARAGGERRPEPAREAVPGLVGRECHYVAEPEAVPSFRDLARIGTVGNISLWGREQSEADTIELSIRYADDGRLQWVRAIRANVRLNRVSALEQLVLESLDETGPADWGVRLLVVAGDVAGTASSVICDPEWVAGSNVSGAGPYDRVARRDFAQARGQRIPVRISLDERGRVVNVELVRSTYSNWVDQYIVDYTRNSLFDPKLHDGMGVATTFELQLRFNR